MKWSWGHDQYFSEVLKGGSSGSAGRIVYRTSLFDQKTTRAAGLTRHTPSEDFQIRTFGKDIPAIIVTDLAGEVRNDLGLAHQTIDLRQRLGRDKDFFGYEHFEDRFAGCGGLRLYKLVNERPVYAVEVIFWDADNRIYVEVFGDGVSLLVVEAMIALANEQFTSH